MPEMVKCRFCEWQVELDPTRLADTWKALLTHIDREHPDKWWEQQAILCLYVRQLDSDRYQARIAS